MAILDGGPLRHSGASRTHTLSLADAIVYNWEWVATVCTAVPHLSVQFVLYSDNFWVPSMLPKLHSGLDSNLRAWTWGSAWTLGSAWLCCCGRKVADLNIYLFSATKQDGVGSSLLSRNPMFAFCSLLYILYSWISRLGRYLIGETHFLVLAPTLIYVNVRNWLMLILEIDIYSCEKLNYARARNWLMLMQETD